MPYVTQFEKDHENDQPMSVGLLTYLLTKTALRFKYQQSPNGCLRFVTIALVMGAFFCAALEFYRRVAAPYEDTKIQENGDVY